MIRFITTMAALVTATAAVSGGLAEPIPYYDPAPAPRIVYEDPTPSWTGVQIGAGVTTKQVTRSFDTTNEVRTDTIDGQTVHTDTSTDTITHTDSSTDTVTHTDTITNNNETVITRTADGYERQCTFGTSESNHQNNKCQISQLTYLGLLESGDITAQQNPWNNRGDDPVLYKTGNYYGIWLNDNTSYNFTSEYGGAAPTDQNKPTVNSVVQQLFTETMTTSSTSSASRVTTVDTGAVTRTTSLSEGDVSRETAQTSSLSSSSEVDGGSYTETHTEATATAYVRYWHDFGTIVAGGELGFYTGDVYAEAQVGFDMGNSVAYFGYAEDHGALGVAYRMTDSIILEARTVKNWETEDVRPELRIGFQF